MAMAPPMVLTFAASDPTSGAGLQADLLTLAALGCHPLSVLTALTAQDTTGVARMQPVDCAWITEQARCVLADVAVAAFKAGVLGSADNTRAVSEIIAAQRGVPLVVDPVLASGRGDALGDDSAVRALAESLLPLTTVLTPNSLEARRLTGEQNLRECARALVQRGCQYVLITGTHEGGGDVVNTLYDASGVVREDRWPRLPHEYHGSGCTLASAIAANLCLGQSLHDACEAASDYVHGALRHAVRPGRGEVAVLNHFWQPVRHGIATASLADASR
jgi:hydroxymethylpyrimidine/phosphomethylpyrimidine kinase